MFNKKQIDEKTYCNIIGLLLKKTYESKINHTFGKYLSPISPFSDEKYLNEVKLFLYNIELKNIKRIGFYFCSKYKSLMQNNIEFTKIETFFRNLNT